MPSGGVHPITRLPSKCLTAPELAALHGAGLSVATVFQQRGGAEGHLSDLTSATGTRDGTRALALAQSLGQPAGSAIYFGVDHDYFRASELAQVATYFNAARDALGGAYEMGSYGSGAVGKSLRDAGLIEFIWLAGARGWSGTAAALNRGDWALFQRDLEHRSPVGGFIYDGNIVNPTFGSFGQFGAAAPVETPRGMGSAALYRVTARRGLNVRAGPGETFRDLTALPQDTVVNGLQREGDWIAVDLEGDGSRDGYMFAEFLEPVSGGLPLALPVGRSPFDVAQAELALNVHEVGGAQHNPRIVMYHATTTGGAAPDETAWCSSFVNYCVEQAGLVGTNSKWARSWHEAGWGRVVTDTPVAGDIVVWRRRDDDEDGGHVGFYVGGDGQTIRVLGGNQSNSVCIDNYPVAGIKGPYRYDLLSIRR